MYVKILLKQKKKGMSLPEREAAIDVQMIKYENIGDESKPFTSPIQSREGLQLANSSKRWLCCAFFTMQTSEL